MFYSLIKRNSRANRKENSIYFVSTILAIIAFYVILSLENMDVIGLSGTWKVMQCRNF